MTLRLREGWEVETDHSGCTAYKREGAASILAYAIVDPDGEVRAYPSGEFGLHSGRFCESMEEAHAYLISVGSESPWEVEP